MWTRVLTRAALAATLLGCVGTPAYENRICDRGGTCPAGYACGEDFRCHSACTINADCKGDAPLCVNGMCTSSTMSPATACRSDRDCASPGLCEVLDSNARCERSTGRCLYAPKVCRTPPSAQCLMNDSLYRTFASEGQCRPESGQCTYAQIDTSCPSCQANCLTPCLGVVCNDLNGGCKRDGHCVAPDPHMPGTMPRCAYTDAPDHATCTVTATGTQPIQRGTCSSGTCLECTNDADCEDQDPCTKDGCDQTNHSCIHVPQNGSCDDGDPCTLNDVCQSGRCTAGAPIVCNRSPGECYASTGTCDPMSGDCQYPLQSAGSSCTDDNNDCTNDVCSATGACLHDPKSPTTACSDGNLCSMNDHCDGHGACSGTAYSCDDNDSCTQDGCDGAGGCTHSPSAPDSLTPGGGQSIDTMEVMLDWRSCAGATSYEAAIEFYGNPAGWYEYYTYNPTASSQTFYPCSSASPSPPCNSDFRFRVRAKFGAVAGPWSAWSVWHWGTCRAC
jgi:hypothetical protein